MWHYGAICCVGISRRQDMQTIAWTCHALVYLRLVQWCAFVCPVFPHCGSRDNVLLEINEISTMKDSSLTQRTESRVIYKHGPCPILNNHYDYDVTTTTTTTTTTNNNNTNKQLPVYMDTQTKESSLNGCTVHIGLRVNLLRSTSS